MSAAGLGTLWLHVGTHKTGTTSIQQAMDRCRAGLAEAGVAMHREVNSWKLANAFLRPGLVTTPRLTGHPLPDAAAIPEAMALVDEMRGTLPGMLISSEEFCLFRDPSEAGALRLALAGRFAQVVPVVVLRNDADWRRSREDQLRKRDLWEAQKRLPDHASTDGEWYYDREAMVAFWAGFGEPAVIDYDSAVAEDGSIIPAFARAIGQEPLFRGVEFWINPSRWRTA